MIGQVGKRGWSTREVQVLEIARIPPLATPSGVSFGMLGAKSSSPSPTLFVFATNIEDSLTSYTYNKVGTILGKHGYLCASLISEKKPHTFSEAVLCDDNSRTDILESPLNSARKTAIVGT